MGIPRVRSVPFKETMSATSKDARTLVLWGPSDTVGSREKSNVKGIECDVAARSDRKNVGDGSDLVPYEQ